MQASRTVHVVDDDQAIRDAVGMMLRTAQYDVHLWPDGFSFLEGAGAFGPSCALLDIRMPDLSGLDVHAALGKIGAPIATTIMTGHGAVATAEHTLRAVATNFLQKPLESSALHPALPGALTPRHQ